MKCQDQQNGSLITMHSSMNGVCVCVCVCVCRCAPFRMISDCGAVRLFSHSRDGRPDQ